MRQEIILSIVWFIIYVVLFVIALRYRRLWQKARDYNTQVMLSLIKSNKRAQVLLVAKILEPLGAGLPSCYYEAMEEQSLEKIADIAVNRIKNTKIQKDE